MRELRLGLDGRRLVFPDGKAVCLGCGAEPAGTRRVWFEELEGGSLAAKARAIAGRVEFDAPLCRAHRAKARWLTIGALLCVLAAGGMIYLGMALTKSKKPTPVQEWGPVLLGLIPGLPAYFLWRMKDRAGLTCDVRRAGEGVVLTFPD